MLMFYRKNMEEKSSASVCLAKELLSIVPNFKQLLHVTKKHKPSSDEMIVYKVCLDASDHFLRD